MIKSRTLIAGAALALATVSGVALSATSNDHEKLPVVKVPLTDWTAVASQKGWLQEEFAKLGTKVELVDVAAMKIPGVEASLLDRGELNFASRMSYPALQHKLNGLDAVVVWSSVDGHPRKVTIVTLKESKINKPNDLIGKKLGGWRLGCPYFGGYEALKKAGIQQDTEFIKGDVRYTNIASTAQTAALLGGRVDALSIHPATANSTPLYTQNLVKEVATSVPGGAYQLGGGRTAIFAMKDFADKYPLHVQAYNRAHERTKKWIKNGNYDAAASIIARELRVPKVVAKYGIADESQLNMSAGEPDYKTAVSRFKLFQEWGVKNGDDFLKKKTLTDAQLNAFVDKRFYKGGQYSIYK